MKIVGIIVLPLLLDDFINTCTLLTTRFTSIGSLNYLHYSLNKIDHLCPLYHVLRFRRVRRHGCWRKNCDRLLVNLYTCNDFECITMRWIWKKNGIQKRIWWIYHGIQEPWMHTYTQFNPERCWKIHISHQIAKSRCLTIWSTVVVVVLLLEAWWKLRIATDMWRSVRKKEHNKWKWKMFTKDRVAIWFPSETKKKKIYTNTVSHQETLSSLCILSSRFTITLNRMQLLNQSDCVLNVLLKYIKVIDRKKNTKTFDWHQIKIGMECLKIIVIGKMWRIRFNLHRTFGHPDLVNEMIDNVIQQLIQFSNTHQSEFTWTSFWNVWYAHKRQKK